MAGTCERCGDRARRRRYCGPCQKVVDDRERAYLQAATNILATEGPLGPLWKELDKWRLKYGIKTDDAQRVVQTVATDWLTRYTASVVAGYITQDEVATFRRAAAALTLPASVVQPLEVRIQREQMMDRVRNDGDMPRASASGLHLPTDELCYLNVDAHRVRHLKTGDRSSQGHLVVTNRKIRFIAFEAGGEIALSKVMYALDIGVYDLALKATSRSLDGDYRVPDAAWAAAVIDGALKLDRRVLLGGGDGLRRAIPQHVKSAVWQRDGGRCVQCGVDTYLEYDHVIPRSKGGADSEGNIQLLCRRCNLQKSDRI
jgi:hypothetical protein